MYATSGISTVVTVEPGDRHEELEERDARDRVEEVARTAPSGASRKRKRKRDEREHERDCEADPDRDQRQLDVLDERGLERVAPVLVHPARCRTSALSAGTRSLAEVRDDRAAAAATQPLIAAGPPASRRRATRRRRPTTTSASRALGDEQRERVAQARRPRQPRQRRPARRRRELELAERPQRERLERPVGPTKSRDELVDRAARGSPPACRTGRACRPARRIAMRSPTLIASSMSCVTKTTVFRTSCCRRRNSSWSRVAHDRVDRAERLVHQHQRRVRGERARKADALALAAGELRRDSASRTTGRGRRARAAPPTRVADPLLRAAEAAAARCRCSPRSSCAGRGRPAG